MKQSGRYQSLCRVLGATVLLCFWSLPVWAQCAMCRAAFNGANGAALAKSMNRGIIVLLIPPVAIFCAIFITAIKYRKDARRLDEERDS